MGTVLSNSDLASPQRFSWARGAAYGDINNQGNVEDFRLVLSLRQFGPDGQLTYTEDFNEVNFYPVTTDGDSRVW